MIKLEIIGKAMFDSRKMQNQKGETYVSTIVDCGNKTFLTILEYGRNYSVYSAGETVRTESNKIFASKKEDSKYCNIYAVI